MMTAVDWWKTLVGAHLSRTPLTGVKCNSPQVIGKFRDAGELRGFATQLITVFPHVFQA
jgi:hypothetical protein